MAVTSRPSPIDLANNVAPQDGKASLLTAMSIVQAVRNRTAVVRF